MNRRKLLAALAVLGLAPRMAKADTGWIVDEIYGAAARYGVSGDTLYNLAVCESNLDPGAVSHKLNQNGYHDLGLFQINPVTWDWWCGEMGFAGDIWSVAHQCKVAAWAVANGYLCHWVCAWCG